MMPEEELPQAQERMIDRAMELKDLGLDLLEIRLREGKGLDKAVVPAHADMQANIHLLRVDDPEGIRRQAAMPAVERPRRVLEADAAEARAPEMPHLLPLHIIRMEDVVRRTHVEGLHAPVADRVARGGVVALQDDLPLFADGL